MSAKAKPDARELSDGDESFRALRHTWTRGFAEEDRANVEALVTLAATLRDGAINGCRWDFDTDAELAGVALDIDSLADYLAWQETAEDDRELDDRERALRRRARAWEARLRALAREIRGAVGEDGEQAEPESVTGPILADLGALTDRVREATGRRRSDAGSRTRRQAMAGALAHLVQAEELLAPAVEAEREAGS